MFGKFPSGTKPDQSRDVYPECTARCLEKTSWAIWTCIKHRNVLIKLLAAHTQIKPEEQHQTLPVWRRFSGGSEAEEPEEAAERPVRGRATFSKTTGRQRKALTHV